MNWSRNQERNSRENFSSFILTDPSTLWFLGSNPWFTISAVEKASRAECLEAEIYLSLPLPLPWIFFTAFASASASIDFVFTASASSSASGHSASNCAIFQLWLFHPIWMKLCKAANIVIDIGPLGTSDHGTLEPHFSSIFFFLILTLIPSHCTSAKERFYRFMKNFKN